MFGAGGGLARQNLGCHLRNALILLHELALLRNIQAGEAAPPVGSRRSPARATNAGRATTPAFAASYGPSSSSLPYLLDEVHRYTIIVSHITKLGSAPPSVEEALDLSLCFVLPLQIKGIEKRREI